MKHRLLSLLLALAMCLSCVVARPIPAGANVLFVQKCTTITLTTCVFTSPPSTGNIVAIWRGNPATGAISCTDSNAVSLSVFTVSNPTYRGTVCYYRVVGTPTGTYTTTSTTGGAGGIEIQGASFATAIGTSVAFSAATTSVTTTPTVNEPTVGINFCGWIDNTNAATTGISVNGNGITDVGSSANRIGYVNNGGSTTSCTATFAGTKTGVLILMSFWGGPTFLHTTACAANPCTVTAPTNGNTEVVQYTATATVSGDTVCDSVSCFTLEHTSCVAGNVMCAVTFDNLVSGSPGTGITVTSSGGGLNASFNYLEISGLAATGTNLFTGNTAASGTSVVGTIAGVGAGDAQIMLGNSTAVSGTLADTFSNNDAGATTLTNTGRARGRFTLATSTASSTATYSLTVSLTNAALEYADYVVPAPAGTVPPSTFLDPGQATVGYVDHPGQLPYYLRGPLIAPLHAGVTCIQRWDGGDECWRFLPL